MDHIPKIIIITKKQAFNSILPVFKFVSIKSGRFNGVLIFVVVVRHCVSRKKENRLDLFRNEDEFDEDLNDEKFWWLWWRNGGVVVVVEK
jgi:hypothetical protein